MKADAVLSYVLSILEGGLAGTFFYRAGQAKEKKCRILMYLSSAAWFVLSVLDGMEGAKALKAIRQAEDGAEDAPEF